MNIDEIQKIWLLVTQLHNNQKYGGENTGEQIEYISHIGGVVFEICAATQQTPGMDREFALHCAFLHDTIEDTAFNIENIDKLFGNKIASGVSALTKNIKIGEKKVQMEDSIKRIKEQPTEVWAVKMADRICNLYAPPFYWTKEKKLEYLEEACYILNELKDGNRFLAKRLASKIDHYRKFLD